MERADVRVTGRRSEPYVDRYVSSRIRQRRIMLGLTQQQMAELIGVSFQQAHRYESGTSKIMAGRLYQLAQALGVEVGYFFEDVDPDSGVQTGPQDMLPQQRMLLELARSFTMIESQEHRDAVCRVARALSHRD